LVIVKSETLIGWHRRFQDVLEDEVGPGRPKLPKDIRQRLSESRGMHLTVDKLPDSVSLSKLSAICSHQNFMLAELFSLSNC
jgi:hypothetical protein